jgi:MFS family permease
MTAENTTRLQKNIPRFYLLKWFSNAQFHLVVYTLFLLSKGLNARQFFLIESGYALISLLMEIPTGVISDRRSRKWSLIAASIIGLPLVPIIILSDSFLVILAAMSIGGVSAAFVSGTDDALLYDTLQALGRKKDFARVLGKSQWYGSLAMALSGIVGGLLAQLDMAYAWWAYLGAGVCALVVACTLQEPPFYRDAEKRVSYLAHLGESLKLAFTGDAAYFVLYGAVIWLFFSIGFWLWQPYLKLTALPLSAYGFLYAALNLVGGYVSRQAHTIESKMGVRRALLFIPLLLALAFLLESQFAFALGFLLIFMQSIASGLFSPLLATYIHTRIPSSKRATVLSIKNMVNSLLFMTLSPLVGAWVDRTSVPDALFLMSVVLVVTSLVFFVTYRKETGAIVTEGTGAIIDVHGE